MRGLQLAEILRKLKTEGNTLVIAGTSSGLVSGITDRYIYISDGGIQWEKTAAQMQALTWEERQTYGLREITEGKWTPPVPCKTGAELSALPPVPQAEENWIFSELNFSLYSGQITALNGKKMAQGRPAWAMVLTGLWKRELWRNPNRGKRLAAGKRRRAVWYNSNDTGTQFYKTASRKNCCFIQTTLRNGWSGAKNIAEKAGLQMRTRTHPAALSGGQKQRLSIACGILSDRGFLSSMSQPAGLMAAIWGLSQMCSVQKRKPEKQFL